MRNSLIYPLVIIALVKPDDARGSGTGLFIGAPSIGMAKITPRLTFIGRKAAGSEPSTFERTC
jgi:hypothetical protein